MNEAFIKKSLNRLGIRPSKMKGQNFLYDDFSRQYIVSSALEFFQRVSKDHIEGIFEVGPGLGSLTEHLLEEELPFRVVELEEKFCQFIKSYYEIGPTQVINSSILDLSIEDIFPSPFYEKVCLISNLPYSISSSTVEWMINYRERICGACLLLQKEFAGKLCAEVGSKDYGSLSIFVQVYADLEVVFEVSGDKFFPKANVLSSLIFIDLSKPSLLSKHGVGDSQGFQSFVKSCFKMRRKTLLNNISKSYKDLSKTKVIEALDQIDKKDSVRAQELSPLEFILLYKKLCP